MAKRIPARLTSSEGRRFGLTVGTAFAVLAALVWWRGHPTTALVPAALGGALVASGLLVPQRLEPVHRAWMGLAHAISRVTTPIFLALVYFLVIAPIGLVMRALGRNPLVHGAGGGTYWVERPRGTASSGDMRRQF